MNQTIRPMTAADTAAVMDMMRSFYASDAVWSNGSDEIFSTDITACIGDNPCLEGYVFEAAGNPIGYAMLAKSFSTEFGKPCIWIEDLYVREAFRGEGIGRAFLTLVTEKYPHCLFRLEVEKENERAVRLYEAFGFEELPYIEMKK